MSKNTLNIAKTIRHQIHCGDRMAFFAWGGRKMVALPEEKTEDGFQLGGLQFDVNGAKLGRGRVRVRLMADDTYTVEIYKNKREMMKIPGLNRRFYNTKKVLVDSMSGVYCDMLTDVIDRRIERN